jgi:hypothetical protein
MGSSGDSGGGGVMQMLNSNAPAGGLPIAGSGANVDPYNYGKYQNFLPDIKAEGPNDNATGLRPDMFKYRSPNGDVDQGGSGAGGQGNQIQELRDMLAKLASQQNGFGNGPPATSPGWGMPVGVGGESGGNSGAP